MECTKVDKIAEKYESGELGYFEQKQFEKHVKSCKKCYKKYKSLLLLGALLYASNKIYSPSLAVQLLKSKVTYLLSFILLTSFTTVMFINKDNKAKNIEKTKSIEKIVTETKSEKIKKSDKVETKTRKRDKIRIISAENGKEVYIDLNKKDMSIEKREEK